MGLLNSPQAPMAVQAAPGILSGLGGLQQADYMAAVTRNNAAIARGNASQALQAGQYNASTVKMRGSTLAAEQQVAQAANGVDVGVGSAAAVRDATQRMSALDAAMVQYNAAKQAFGFETQAATDETQAKLYKMSGRNALFTGLAKASSAAVGAAAAYPSAGGAKVPGAVINSGSTLSPKWMNYIADDGVN